MTCVVCDYSSLDEQKFVHLKPFSKRPVCKNCCFDLGQVVKHEMQLKGKKNA